MNVGPVLARGNSASPRMPNFGEPSLLVKTQPIRDNYKDKYENVKLLVKHQKKELDEIRIAMQGTESVRKSLEEERNESARIKDLLKDKDIEIRALQEKLNQRTLDSGMRLGGQLLNITEMSRDVLESVTEENMRLRSQFKYLPFDATHMDALIAKCKKYQVLIEETRKKNEELQMDNQKLLAMFESSDDAKNQKIVKLLTEKSQLEKDRQQQLLLCYSLTEELQNLRCRTEAGSTAVQNHTFPQKSKIQLDYPTKERDQKIMQEQERRINELGSQLDAKAKDVLEYKTKLEELTKMNMNWQRYQQVIEKKMRDLDSELVKAREEGVSAQQQEKFDEMLSKLKDKKNHEEEEKLKAEDECRKLEAQLTKRSEEIEKLKKENFDLRKKSSGISKKDLEEQENMVAFLRHQVEACTDDFNRERADHRQALKRIQELEHDRNLYMKQLEQFQQGALPYLNHNRMQNFNRQVGNYHNMHSRAASSAMNIRDVSDTIDEDCDVIDSLPTPPVVHANRPSASDDIRSVSSAPGNIQGSPGRSSSRRPHQQQQTPADTAAYSKQGTTLQCPKCSMQFSSNDHLSLMDHIEECC